MKLSVCIFVVRRGVHARGFLVYGVTLFSAVALFFLFLFKIRYLVLPELWFRVYEMFELGDCAFRRFREGDIRFALFFVIVR